MSVRTPHRMESAERLLAKRGRTFGRVRIAAGRSGVAVGFPNDPKLHVAWLAFPVVFVVYRVLRRR